MESEKSKLENQSAGTTATPLAAATIPTPPAAPATLTSCRKKKNEQATFLEDVKDHIDEFIHASMDEHVSCFKKTVDKMFKMSKVVAVAEKNAADAKGVDFSSPPNNSSRLISSPILSGSVTSILMILHHD